MAVQHFTLIVDGADLQSQSLIDALFAAGCDDVPVGRTDGVQYLDFDREADSLGEAIISAVKDVEKVEGVQVQRVAGVPHGGRRPLKLRQSENRSG